MFGIQSDFCVEKTTKGALKAGFHATVLSGAHSTYDSDGKSAAEIEAEVDGQLRKLGARAVEWGEVISTWKRENRIS